MKTRLALAISLVISTTTAISATPIKIKDMYLGMTVDNAVIALSNALSIPAKNFIVVKLDGDKSCIFSPGLKLDFDSEVDGDKVLCETTVNNPAGIIHMMQYDVGVRLSKTMNGVALDQYGIRQMAPLATFNNNAMVTMTFESNVTNAIFSYDKTDFTVFAKGFVDAYGIPTLNKMPCTFSSDLKCWDYSDNNGTLVSIIDLKTAAPIIQMFKTRAIKF